MTVESKIKEISANLRLASLNVDQDIKEKLLKIAQDLSDFQNQTFNSNYDVLDDAQIMDIGENNIPNIETKPGQFDINREPNLPLWNIQILRVRASNGEDAHNIVQQLVQQLQESGHSMAAVGEIRPATDQINPKGK